MAHALQALNPGTFRLVCTTSDRPNSVEYDACTLLQWADRSHATFPALIDPLSFNLWTAPTLKTTTLADEQL